MKKKMSKHVALLLAVVTTAGSLTDCSEGQSTPTGTTTAEVKAKDTKAEEPAGSTEVAKAEEGTGDKVRIAFIPQLIGIPYLSAMESGGKKVAEDLEMEFLYTGSTQTSAVEQVKIMDSLIKQGVNAISLSVLDSSSTNPYIKKAQEAGTKVYISGSDALNSIRDFYVAQALGKGLGTTLVDCLGKQTGGNGKVGIVSGESTAANLDTWIDYIKQRQEEKYPGIEIVDIRCTQGGGSEQASKQVQELVTRYPDLKGLVTVASSTTPGVAQAVQQGGKTGEVAVIGYGSSTTVKPFIEPGVMKQSVLQNAYDLGYLTVWAGKMAAEDREFEATNQVECIADPVTWDAENKTLLLGQPLIIDEDNISDFDF